MLLKKLHLLDFVLLNQLSGLVLIRRSCRRERCQVEAMDMLSYLLCHRNYRFIALDRKPPALAGGRSLETLISLPHLTKAH